MRARRQRRLPGGARDYKFRQQPTSPLPPMELQAKAAQGKAAVFRELQSRKENRTCFDCPGTGAVWASVTHGVFVCLDCSGVHRSLGTHLTFIRSTTMDSWQVHR